MKFFLKYTLAAMSLFSFVRCGGYYTDVAKKDSKIVERQYLALLKESDAFLSAPDQQNFIPKLQTYIAEINNENLKDGKQPAVFLHPIITAENHQKALVIHLSRELDMAGKRIDYVKFISARNVDGHWDFKLKKGHTFAFRYVDEKVKSATDDQLARNTVRNLMLQSYFKNGGVYDESLFSSGWYSFK